MGETTVFECSVCGYKSGAVRWGVGSDNPRIRFLPAVCRNCRDIIEVDLSGRDVLIETFACSVCASPVSFFHKADSFACPRCSAPNLIIRQTGYW